MKQQTFNFFTNLPKECGGTQAVNKRKSQRTLSTKSPIHLVLRSDKAKGVCSFVNHQIVLNKLITRLAKKHRIKIYAHAINWNHIHFVIRVFHRRNYNCWIRDLTGQIVQYISLKTKTHLSEFFTVRPYTRLVSWGREFKTVIEYQILNKMEVFGLRPRKSGNTS
ncbi:MAG: hypothetical protein AABY64_13170 [Bdellovibrionota bacterium]